MATKDWLNRGRTITKEIEDLECDKRRAIEDATKITVTLRERVNTGKAGKRNDAALVEIADYGMLIEEKIAELYRTRNEISKAIYAVEDGVLRRLLINRYIMSNEQGKQLSWEQISINLNNGFENVTQRLHPRALNAVRKYIPEEDLID